MRDIGWYIYGAFMGISIILIGRAMFGTFPKDPQELLSCFMGGALGGVIWASLQRWGRPKG